MSSIPRVKEGDELSAKHYNSLVDGVNRDPLLGGAGQVLQSIDGAVNAPAGIIIELFEITGHLEIESTSGVSDGVYSCPVRSVTYLHSQDPGGNPNQYRGYDHTNPDALETRLYFPTTLTQPRLGTIPNAPIMAPPFGYQLAIETTLSPRSSEANPMVWGALNLQSGRWEYLGPSETILRFQTLSSKSASDDGVQEVWVLGYNRQSEIWEIGSQTAGQDQTTVVYDPMQKFAWTSGARGFAKMMGDSGKFEVINVQTIVGDDENQQVAYQFDEQGDEFFGPTDQPIIFESLTDAYDAAFFEGVGSGVTKCKVAGTYELFYDLTTEPTGTTSYTDGDAQYYEALVVPQTSPDNAVWADMDGDCKKTIGGLRLNVDAADLSIATNASKHHVFSIEEATYVRLVVRDVTLEEPGGGSDGKGIAFRAGQNSFGIRYLRDS